MSRPLSASPLAAAAAMKTDARAARPHHRCCFRIGCAAGVKRSFVRAGLMETRRGRSVWPISRDLSHMKRRHLSLQLCQRVCFNYGEKNILS